MLWLSTGLQAKFTGSSPTGLETIDVGAFFKKVKGHFYLTWEGGERALAIQPRLAFNS